MEEEKTINLVETENQEEQTQNPQVSQKISENERKTLNKNQMDYNQCLIEIGDLELTIGNYTQRKNTIKESFVKAEGEFNKYLDLLKAKYNLEDEQITGDLLKEKTTEEEFETLSKHKTETSDILAALGDNVVSLDTLEKRMSEVKDKLSEIKSTVDQFLQTLKYKYNLDDKARINFNTGEIL